MRISANNAAPSVLVGPCDYAANWLADEQATRLQQQLQQQIPWQEGQITLFGKTHAIPRTQAWLSENGSPYRYSNALLPSQGWPDVLQQLSEALRSRLQQPFNSCLLNRYQHGQQLMGWHADDEPELGPNPAVAILSLGQARDLLIKAKQNPKDRFSIRLDHGSLLYMPPPMQQHWLHALPKRSLRHCPGTRISLTFRMRYT